MKAIVHIGMPKTGTTVLQHVLFSSRKQLNKKGVLYPDPGVRNGYNHGLLAGVALSYDEAPREFKKISPEEYEKRVTHFVSKMLEQIETHKPDLLLLSSEYLRRVFKAENAERFVEVLAKTGALEREFVLYIRRPSDFFLSDCQQKLRASSKIKDIDSRLNNAALEALSGYSAAFPGDRLTVNLFDRASLAEGDIVADFVQRYLPEHKDILRDAVSEVPANVSLSAESMALLQRFRKDIYAEQDEMYNTPTRKFHDRLKVLDREFQNKRPTLLPQIRDYCDYADASALVLRDKYGIEFPDFDYERLECGDFAPRPIINGQVNEVVPVDESRVQTMVEALRFDKKNTPELAAWIEARSSTRSPPASAWQFLRLRLSRKKP